MSVYPFPPGCPQKIALPWYRFILPRVFGEKFDETHKGMRFTAYWWRGTLYITRYSSIWL